MITIHTLFFQYPRKRQVYSDLNLTIEEGAVYALLGLNGAGKTTLLSLIAGFLIPQQGTCQVLGYEASKRNPEMLQEIFLVSDTSDFPNMSIAAFCELYTDFYPRFDRNFFNYCLSEFTLTPESSLKMLSYGDKRKVMLSFALATNCRLLLLDEPTNGLDIPSKATFRKLVASSLGENQTIVLATHQVRDLANLMDRIIIEHQSEVIINEPIDTITEKLTFGLIPDQIENGNLLYKADSLNPYETVSVNKTGQGGQVDIELLFNAAVTYPKELSKIFITQNQAL
ncbi:MAG: ATP-binding cassette domain-containing protein [Methanococcaceae archaeon]